MQWELKAKKTILQTTPFAVEALELEDTRNVEIDSPYHRLACPDWVTVLAVTHDQLAVLIRQSRVGSWSNILETPGGALDPHEKDPTMAAIRELEEETGYTSQRVLPLASLNPNPAIMTNKIHMFLALSATINPNRQHFPDRSEHIETELVPITELDLLVRSGQINHCLSALCIQLAGKYIKISEGS